MKNLRIILFELQMLSFELSQFIVIILFSGSGEIIGSIIEEENKMLRRKLNAAESKIKELEEKLEKFEMVI